MNNTDKPRIRWWGNGDVHTDCHNAFIKCYPNADYSKVTFRSNYQLFDMSKLVWSLPNLKVSTVTNER